MSTETPAQPTPARFTSRLFFAILPDEATRTQIGTVRRHLPHRQGRQVTLANLHLTLAFIGPVDPAHVPCLDSHPEGLAVAPFEVALDTIGGFPRAQVIWIAPSVMPDALGHLANALNAILKTCGCVPESRPFRPHMTLMRKAEPVAETLAIRPIAWRVEAFYLMASRDTSAGVAYRVHKRFALAGLQE